MLESWALGRSFITHDVCEGITFPVGAQLIPIYERRRLFVPQVALCVIAQAGFGQEIRWGSEVVPSGHHITFKQALFTVSSNMHLPLMLPGWAWGLRGHWRKVKFALDELKVGLNLLLSFSIAH